MAAGSPALWPGVRWDARGWKARMGRSGGPVRRMPTMGGELAFFLALFELYRGEWAVLAVLGIECQGCGWHSSGGMARIGDLRACRRKCLRMLDLWAALPGIARRKES